jgi:hypothetical protein
MHEAADHAALAEPAPDRVVEARLVLALGVAAQALQQHERVLALALAELGEIELPDGAPTAADAARIEPLGPFYLAAQLEGAGLLRTAESVAGLYASGAITAELGATGARIQRFWQERRNRLTEAERRQLYDTVFESPHVERMLGALCEALADHADNGDATDWRETARLEQAAQRLGLFLAERGGGIVAWSAREIVATLGEAVAFLREPALQAAFSVQSLWALVRVAAEPGAVGSFNPGDWVDRGRSGQTVLGWLTAATRAGRFAFDPRLPANQAVLAAAERWLLAQEPAVNAPMSARAETGSP